MLLSAGVVAVAVGDDESMELCWPLPPATMGVASAVMLVSENVGVARMVEVKLLREVGRNAGMVNRSPSIVVVYTSGLRGSVVTSPSESVARNTRAVLVDAAVVVLKRPVLDVRGPVANKSQHKFCRYSLRVKYP